MSRYQRITALHRLLKDARRPVSLNQLMHATGRSRATVFRDLAFLRDALGAPLVSIDAVCSDGHVGGYGYAHAQGESFELPGLWLNSEGLHALLASQQLLAHTTGALLADTLAPLQQRISRLLNEMHGGKSWPIERVRVIPYHRRKQDEQVFRTVASATLARQQLQFAYRARSTNETTRRHVSPQRITHYRGNWYLDAFDHQRDGLRSFSVDKISHAHCLTDTAIDVDDATLNQHLGSGYGIFSGDVRGWAQIRFSAKAARWVADEHWHSRQQDQWLEDGRLERKIPYSAARELLMDILQYGADAEVIAPVSLREQLKTMLTLAIARYQ